MGLGSWISNAFGSNQEKQDVPQAAYGQGAADADKQRMQGLGQAYQDRGQIQANGADQQADYGQQQQALGMMQQAAAGNAPSAAALQMQQGTDASVRAQMAGAAGARGGGLAQSLAGLNAQGQAANMQQANVGATGQLRAQEMAQARGAYGQMATGMRGQSQQFALGQGQLALGSRSANDQAQLGAEGIGQGYQGIAAQGDIAHMNAQAKANSENAANNQANGAGLVGMAGGALKAYAATSDAQAKQGIHRLDVEDHIGAGGPPAWWATGQDPHHPPPVQVHVHNHAPPPAGPHYGDPHQAMRFGARGAGYTAADARGSQWADPLPAADDREYDVASGHSWKRNEGPAAAPPPPASWAHAGLAQRMTDEAGAGGDPSHSQREAPFNRSGIDAEFRDASSTPGSGRYGMGMGRTGSDAESARRDEEAHRLADALEAQRAEAEAVHRRIGSPKVISDEGAKVDVSAQGGSGGKALGAIGSGMEEFGRVAGKVKGGDSSPVGQVDQSALAPKKIDKPEGGEAHVMTAGATPDAPMKLGDVTPVQPAAAGAEEKAEAGSGPSPVVDFGPQGPAPEVGGANYTGSGGKIGSDKRMKEDIEGASTGRGRSFSEAITQSARSGIREAPAPTGEHPDYSTYYDDSGQIGPHHTPHSQFFQRVAFHHPTPTGTVTSDRQAKQAVEQLGERGGRVIREADAPGNDWYTQQQTPSGPHSLASRLGASMTRQQEDREGYRRETGRAGSFGPSPHNASVTSDRGAKTPPVGAGGPMVHFMEALHPYSYRYKDGRDDTMGQQGATRVGIIAQEANADPVGHTMIERMKAPDGHQRLAINMGAGLSVALASIAALQEEVDSLRGKGGRRG